MIFAYNNLLWRSFSKRCKRCCRVSATIGCLCLAWPMSLCFAAGKWLCMYAWNTGAGKLLAGGGYARAMSSLLKVEVVADCGVDRSTLDCCLGREEPVPKWNLARSRFPSRVQEMSVKEKITHFRDNPLLSNTNFGMGIIIGSNPSRPSGRWQISYSRLSFRTSSS